MPEIGATLREARMRARIDVSEIEAQTKIRAKYLRALENEEWSLLPGPTFVKSFLRTYAQALGLDAKALVEEYRLSEERPQDPYEPLAATPRAGRPRSPRSGPSRGYLAAVAGVLALIVLLIVLLATGGGGSGGGGSGGGRHAKTAKTTATRTAASSGGTTTTAPAQPETLSIRATGAVYVCLIGDHGRKLVDGRTLQAGEATSTYTAHRFLLTLGNASAVLLLNGRERTVPPSSEPIGYALVRGHGREKLSSEQRPTCK
jgi:transcriptional regulator with XRE-family HTH domain